MPRRTSAALHPRPATASTADPSWPSSGAYPFGNMTCRTFPLALTFMAGSRPDCHEKPWTSQGLPAFFCSPVLALRFPHSGIVSDSFSRHQGVKWGSLRPISLCRAWRHRRRCCWLPPANSSPEPPRAQPRVEGMDDRGAACASAAPGSSGSIIIGGLCGIVALLMSLNLCADDLGRRQPGPPPARLTISGIGFRPARARFVGEISLRRRRNLRIPGRTNIPAGRTYLFGETLSSPSRWRGSAGVWFLLPGRDSVLDSCARG